MSPEELKAREIFGDTELWRSGHPLHIKRMLARGRAALAAAASGGDVQQAPGEAPQSGDAKQRNAQGPSHD